MRDIVARAEQAERAARIHPADLIAYAQTKGWRRMANSLGVVLMEPPIRSRAQLMVPRDQKDVGFVDAMLDAVQRLMTLEARSFDAVMVDINPGLINPEVAKERERIAEWLEDVDAVYLGIFNGSDCRKGEIDDLADGLREIAARVREGKAHL